LRSSATLSLKCPERELSLNHKYSLDVTSVEKVDSTELLSRKLRTHRANERQREDTNLIVTEGVLEGTVPYIYPRMFGGPYNWNYSTAVTSPVLFKQGVMV
jgi:hypothetical protein